MDGSVVSTKGGVRPRKHKSKIKKPSWLARQHLNEHHRKPRSQQGGRGHADLNITKVGIEIHKCFHALFATHSPPIVCAIINAKFVDACEYLVPVPTKFFAAFHQYFTNRGVIPWVGMAGHGLTWGHLYLFSTADDLLGTFRGRRHYFTKPDPRGDASNRWQYLFTHLSMPCIAYQLTRYWLPLDCVIVAIPKQHQVEVDTFLENMTTKKMPA